ncbi:MAG: prepilin-type N-terminal cleavage/methylation domain-containing protein [Planctomycetota bacterium]
MVLPQIGRPQRHGLSLLELLAVVAILGVLAVMIIPRLSSGAHESKRHSCHVQRGVIEIQAALWRREFGAWPQSDLGDISAAQAFFPEGLPTCPVDGSPYTFDAGSGRVTGHGH